MTEYHAGNSPVHLRAMRTEDVPAGLRLCRLANWNQVAEDWRFFLTSSPDGCRVAEDDEGAVIGTVATIAYGVEFSWIGMVLVDPEHRRRGIGTYLLHEALEVLGDGTTARLDATPAGRAVYAPLGFVDEYELQRMERPVTVRLKVDPADDPASPGWVRLKADRGVRQMSDADFDEVLTFDRDVFGADRRALLERLRNQAPEYAWTIGGAHVDGYLFGRHGHRFEHLGPIGARDEATARVLVSACVSAHVDRPFIVDAPRRASWVEWLASHGFSLQRPFTRMRRGEARFVEHVERLYAIAGPEFG